MENIVIGVRFKKTGKLYYFDPVKYTFKIGDFVIANTERGQELGRVVKVIDKSLINEKEEKIIEHLGKTYNVVEKLADDMQVENIEKER